MTSTLREGAPARRGGGPDAPHRARGPRLGLDGGGTYAGPGPPKLSRRRIFSPPSPPSPRAAARSPRGGPCEIAPSRAVQLRLPRVRVEPGDVVAAPEETNRGGRGAPAGTNAVVGEGPASVRPWRRERVGVAAARAVEAERRKEDPQHPTENDDALQGWGVSIAIRQVSAIEASSIGRARGSTRGEPRLTVEATRESTGSTPSRTFQFADQVSDRPAVRWTPRVVRNASACRRRPVGSKPFLVSAYRVRSPFVFTLVRDGVGGRVGRGRGRGCDRGRAALASANAERAVPATLAETQWRALADGWTRRRRAPERVRPARERRASSRRTAASPAPVLSSAASAASSRPRRKPRVVAWRLDLATLTQSGGGRGCATRSCSFDRARAPRRSRGTPAPASARPRRRASAPRAPRPVPPRTSPTSTCIKSSRSSRTTRACARRPAGAIVRDAGRDGDPPRDVDPRGSGRLHAERRKEGVCCMIFIVAVACVPVAVR